MVFHIGHQLRQTLTLMGASAAVMDIAEGGTAPARAAPAIGSGRGLGQGQP
jgi:hypothetical protein